MTHPGGGLVIDFSRNISVIFLHKLRNVALTATVGVSRRARIGRDGMGWDAAVAAF